MADYALERSIGARIRAARKTRGFKSSHDLANAIGAPNLTEAIIENIEAGRKLDLNISQVLNIAMVLHVPVSSLLAPMARPSDSLDLPNLASRFAGMTASEFDAWLASIPNAEYRADTAAERNDLAELQALRELQVLHRELRRLSLIKDLADNELNGTDDRIEDTARQIEQLRTYLASAGWDLDTGD